MNECLNRPKAGVIEMKKGKEYEIVENIKVPKAFLLENGRANECEDVELKYGDVIEVKRTIF